MSKSAYIRLPSGYVIETNRPEAWGEGIRIPAAEGYRILRAEATDVLRAMLNPGDRVYTIVRSVSRSGMQRKLSVLVCSEGRIRNVTALVCRSSGIGYRDGEAVVGGCGFDAGFHIVYALGASLWPDGTPTPHGRRNGEPDCAGGYALKHESL